LCRRTRQIVAYALGDRSDITATDLRCNLRKGYEQCRSVSDLWPAYAEVFDPDRHLSCAYRGETNHVERFNATLRNRLGRLTRRTLSFSKSHTMHQAVIHTFLLAYNEQISKKLESR
jgi:IS1 family transposase